MARHENPIAERPTDEAIALVRQQVEKSKVGKKNQIAKMVKDFDAQTLEFTFKTTPERVVLYTLADLPADIQVKCMVAGAGKTLANAFAGDCPSAEEGFNRCEAKYQSMMGGEWSLGKGGGVSYGDLITALCEYYVEKGIEHTKETVAKMLKSQSPDWRSALRVKPVIKTILDKNAMEKVKGDIEIDLDSAMDDLS